MKNIKKISTIIAVSLLSIFGLWLIKKGNYDKGYDGKIQERLYLVDAVLLLRGLPVNISNRNMLNSMSIDDLMKELKIAKNEDGDYIDI